MFGGGGGGGGWGGVGRLIRCTDSRVGMFCDIPRCKIHYTVSRVAM